MNKGTVVLIGVTFLAILTFFRAGAQAQQDPVGGPLPVGTIVAFYGNIQDIPTDWKLCDGRATPGDSSLYRHRNVRTLPDLRGRFLRGRLPGSTELGEMGGSDAQSLPSHLHALGDRTGSITNWGPDPGRHDYLARDDHATHWRRSHLRNDGGSPTEGQHYHSLRGLRTGNPERARTISTVPPYVSVDFIIKVN